MRSMEVSPTRGHLIAFPRLVQKGERAHPHRPPFDTACGLGHRIPAGKIHIGTILFSCRLVVTGNLSDVTGRDER